MEQHGKELTALYAISKLLGHAAGQRQMLRDVLCILSDELGMARGTIMLNALEQGHLVVEAAPGAESADPDLRYQKGEGIMGRVLQTGRAEVVRSIADEPRFQGRIHHRDQTRGEQLSFICVPILLEREVVGTLSVDMAYESDGQLDASRRLLTIVASLIAYDVKTRRVAQATHDALEAENLRLRSALGERFRPEGIIGNSGAMRAVYQRIHQVAASDTTVLIRGESGTGKELVASAIHYGSPRAARPFVKVNCAALSESLIESELFGHEAGAFTGAVKARAGRIEEAGGGTLFLDEIGDFSPAVQIKLLRVLQEKEYARVGSNTCIKGDVRVVAATNRDLEAAVRDGSFRQDLYYRVNVFPIQLPALRERKSDILLLADHFAREFGKRGGKEIHRISTAAINAMLAYHWPGNVRELQNCIEHAVLLSADGAIHEQNLPPTLQMPETISKHGAGTLKANVRALERDMIIDALKRHQDSVRSVAEELGITPRMVRYKLKSLGIGNTPAP
jgi:Nif-specific regulatory protein